MKRYKLLNGINCSYAADYKYKIQYLEGIFNQTIEGTMGIMCFNTSNNAIKYIYNDMKYCKNHNILIKPGSELDKFNTDNIHSKLYSVETFQELNVPKLIGFGDGISIDNYLDYKDDIKELLDYYKEELSRKGYFFVETDITSIGFKKPPKGTICAKAVKLLELENIIILEKRR